MSTNPAQTLSALPRTPCSASCCFNCKHWNGKRRKDRAYCYRLNLSGKDATRGNSVCVLWEKRINARTPNVNMEAPNA
jgi:hypothetical protein